MVGTMNLLRRKSHIRYEMTLHFLLREIRPFSVTDLRDNIFAIPGIYGGDCEIKAEYIKEKSEVSIEATKCIIGHEKKLDMFEQTGAPEGRESDLPSWAPDYGSVSDSHGPAIGLCIPQAKYKASGRTNPSTSWPLTQYPNIIQTTSYHSDPIVAMVDVPPVHRTEQILWFSRLASSLGPKYVTGETILEAFWRNCVTDESALCEQPVPISYLKALGVHARVAASSIADADGALFQSLSKQVLDELTSQYFACADLSNGEKTREVVTEVILHLGSRTHNRKLFVTTAGYLCLATASAKVGDEVHFIAGPKVPFILQRDEKGSMKQHDGDLGLYTLIGEAYVHGLTKGEALQRDGFEWQNILLK